MFQNPVGNLDGIRKVRKRVKGILVGIGLDRCRELLKDLEGSEPGETSSSWGAVSLWEPSRHRVRYRSKPYCCSLCKYSTKMLPSLRNHLHRCHKDQADQELLTPCPNCQFASRPGVVDGHVQMFHAHARRVQSAAVSILGEELRSPRSDDGMGFTCLKCNFSNALYHNMKKHVLVAHFQSFVNSYVGLHAEETGAPPTGSNTLGVKTPPSDSYYCKRCNVCASNQDALMQHVLTVHVHEDLETKLRSVIAQHSKRTGLLTQACVTPNPTSRLAMKPNNSAPGVAALPPGFHLALPQNHQNVAIAQPVTVALDTSRSLPYSLPATTQSHVTLVSSPLSLCQSNHTLPPSAPLPVFFSHRIPLNQPVNTPMLTLGHPSGSVNKPERASILMNQTIHSPWDFTSHPSPGGHKETCGTWHPAGGSLFQPPGYAGGLTRDDFHGLSGTFLGTCRPHNSY